MNNILISNQKKVIGLHKKCILDYACGLTHDDWDDFIDYCLSEFGCNHFLFFVDGDFDYNERNKDYEIELYRPKYSIPIIAKGKYRNGGNGYIILEI